MEFKIVIESEDVKIYLEKRNLLKQYFKAKSFILGGHPELVDLKLREPKNEGIYYFRINKQFRGIGISETIINKNGEKFEKINVLKVIKISNHQNG